MPNHLATQNEDALEKKLEEIRVKGTEDEYRDRATKLGLPFSDLASAPIDPEALALLPEEIARTSQLVVILKTGRKLTVACVDPSSDQAKDAISELEKKGFSIQLLATSPAGLEKALQRYVSLKKAEAFETGSVEINEEDLEALQDQVASIGDLKSRVAGITVTKLLEILLAGGLKIGASDIHFEPQAQAVRLRYRLDGMLQDITDVDAASYAKVVNRIKVLSRLKLNIHNAPQDGRFTIRQKTVDIEIRVSILPGEYGETIVMRILDPRSIKAKLEDLGLRSDLLESVKSQLEKPVGAIITTGPTGSGKTTTLYAFINYLNDPENKIITIEDPIEYHIQGISQTQVNQEQDYSFANGLRAIVRQDPDIILVGEIRDTETAEIALNAALTGHLVLSTIHTNDAAGTVPRLINLKVNPQIIAPAIRMAMAQRLVRKLCTACAKAKTTSAQEKSLIENILQPIADRIPLPDIQLSEPVGCKACNGSGYKGRLGVFEAFAITPEMEKLILTNPAMSAIQELAVKEGMVTMKQDGYLKVAQGVTTMEEVDRVVG